LTWNISDNGDLELINLKYYWTTQNFSSLNISSVEQEGQTTLEGIPYSAKFIQISVANIRGESPLSESFVIQCGYKGCEQRPTVEIIIGVVSSVVLVSLVVFLLFFIRRCSF
jgi:hypothetical protein